MILLTSAHDNRVKAKDNSIRVDDTTESTPVPLLPPLPLALNAGGCSVEFQRPHRRCRQTPRVERKHQKVGL